MYQDVPQPVIINKGKQKKDVVQDKEVFLYKLYNIVLKTLQSLTKTIPFLLLSYYKTIQ